MSQALQACRQTLHFYFTPDSPYIVSTTSNFLISTTGILNRLEIPAQCINISSKSQESWMAQLGNFTLWELKLCARLFTVRWGSWSTRHLHAWWATERIVLASKGERTKRCDFELLQKDGFLQTWLTQDRKNTYELFTTVKRFLLSTYVSSSDKSPPNPELQSKQPLTSLMLFQNFCTYSSQQEAPFQNVPLSPSSLNHHSSHQN